MELKNKTRNYELWRKPSELWRLEREIMNNKIKSDKKKKKRKKRNRKIGGGIEGYERIGWRGSGAFGLCLVPLSRLVFALEEF